MNAKIKRNKANAQTGSILYELSDDVPRKTLSQPVQRQFHEKFGNDGRVDMLLFYDHKCYKLRTEEVDGSVFDQEPFKKELKGEGVKDDDIICLNDLILLNHLKY